MKDDENIESMFSRFQVGASGLHILNKIYTISDLVKKILRSLPTKYKPKVTAIREATYLNTFSIEGLVINLQSHEMESNGDEHEK